MKSNEQEEKNRSSSEKLDFSLVKFFWQANPIVRTSKNTIPRFLRRINVLRNFSENELRILANTMHRRSFGNREIIFKQGDSGIGFYFIYSGEVDIIVEEDRQVDSLKKEEKESRYVLSLEKFDYFGELALLQENSMRSATVLAREHCEVLGIFKPDMEELTENHPVVATKLLQAISIIISNRLLSLTKTVKNLKYKLSQYENINE